MASTRGAFLDDIVQTNSPAPEISINDTRPNTLDSCFSFHPKHTKKALSWSQSSSFLLIELASFFPFLFIHFLIMSFPKHILLAATLLLGSVSTTAAAPVPSLDLLSRGTDEAGHFLETRGEDVYLRFREAGKESSIGEIAKPKFPMKSKTTITKAKSPRKPARTRKLKESNIWTKKVSGKLGAKNFANAAARKIAAHKAKGPRKSNSEKYATGADLKKTKSRSGHHRHRGPERKGNTGDRNQGSSQKRMRKRNEKPQPVSPQGSSPPSGHSSRVSALSDSSKLPNPPPRPQTPSPQTPSPPPRPQTPRPQTPSYTANPPPDLNKPLPPTPGGTFQKVIKKAKSFFKPKKG